MRGLYLSRLWLVAIGLSLLPAPIPAQAPIPVDSNSRLTYRFERPAKTGLALAKAGLPTFDGEFVTINLEQGDSIGEIVGRVRPQTWAQNPEVWGAVPGGGPQVDFGRIQSYLAGDPRFRILAKPATCAGCEGMHEVIFLRYNDTGYLVGGPRQPHP